MIGDVTTLADVLRAGESVVWSGRPDLRLAPQIWLPLALQVVIAAGFFWTSRTIDAPEMTAFFALVFVGLLLWQAVGVPMTARRRLARTTYFLTNRRAIVADGKSVQTIGLGASPMLKYVAGGRRVTATFGPSGPPARFEWARTPPKDALVFANVSDVEGLVSALDQLARGSEPRQLRSDWDGYEADGSAANYSQHLPEQPFT